MITQEWEKISTDYVSGKGLVSRIYKKSYNLAVRKQPNYEMMEDLCRYFSRDKHMAIWHIKRCSISLVIGEMQITTTVRNYCVLTYEDDRN